MSDKKVTDDKINVAISRIGQNMDKFGNVDVNPEDLGNVALSSSSANPLLGGSDVTSSLRDVKNLLPDEEDDDQEEQEEEEEDSEDPDDEGSSKGKPKPKGAWWPREAFVVKKEAEMEAMVVKDEKALRDAHAALVKDVQVSCDRFECML